MIVRRGCIGCHWLVIKYHFIFNSLIEKTTCRIMSYIMEIVPICQSRPSLYRDFHSLKGLIDSHISKLEIS